MDLLLYGDDQYFIGIVKFFDVNKDFGFIASNNCNMPSKKYSQNFYVNSASFIEEEAKKEGRIVVFQVLKQSNGKTRAVNVRWMTKSDDDVNLALCYYGEHEFIEYKDGRKINLYSHLYKPREKVAEKVQSIIINDKERSPKRTAEHFKFFVSHYKTDCPAKGRYVFDRDFTRPEKSLWISLFSILTDDEKIEILNTYPTAVRYVDDNGIIHRWLANICLDGSSLSKLQEFYMTIDLLPTDCQNEAKESLEKGVDSSIRVILEQLSQRSNVGEVEIDQELHRYLRLTSRNYDGEKKQCLKSIRDNHLKKELDEFTARSSDPYMLSSLVKFFNSMSEEEKGMHLTELQERLTPVLECFISDKDYLKAVKLISSFPLLSKIWANLSKQLLPLIAKDLEKQAEDDLDSAYRLKENFFPNYRSLTSIYSEEDKEAIKQPIIPILLKTQSLDVLSLISSEYSWVDVSVALSHAKTIISSWNFNTLKEFISQEPDLFEETPEFADIVIEHALQLIGNLRLSDFFDGTPTSEANGLYSRNPERENCSFLNDLIKLIPAGEKNTRWETYIQSRTYEDLLILFDNNVITSLPEFVIEKIISSISLKDIYSENDRWYNRPTLKNQTYIKALKSTSADLVSLIANRLTQLELSSDIIPLAVVLTELMTCNKPKGDDYYALRNWEQNFKARLMRLKQENSSNQRLSAILWAVHFQTSTSMRTFTEIFPYLPPYIQIRSVKKLFQLIAQGKISYTAESLYELISQGGKSICFPLEIVFTYLKLREKDPNATLNNNVMLQLLEGREDHEEWIGIRHFVTECEGRWRPKELPDDYTNKQRHRYFNGIIKKTSDGRICVFDPYKMIDSSGELRDYNNKYYNSITELIKITYDETEYQTAHDQQGVLYYFDESHEIDLFAIARSFNMKFNRLDNFLGFERNEADDDVFCECRLSNQVDNWYGVAFYWCGNKPCFRTPVRFMLDSEWEYYTLLDFMRILKIPTDYVNREGKRTMFGHYIILSSYLKSFVKFYEHLKCRECGKLMRPHGITNFTTRAVNEFSCINENCSNKGNTVYLNHCFNKRKCNATIDSRDSKQCPNGQYICPECGACCSTENFRLRINHLKMTGGRISEGLLRFVYNNMGHWEKQEYFCYKCGKPMTNESGVYRCKECNIEYDHS